MRLLRKVPKLTIFATFIVAAVTTSVFADTADFPPSQATICGPDHIVDKDKLAVYLLKKFPVSVLAFTPSSDPTIASLSPIRQILVSNALASPKDCQSCTSADRDSLNSIRGNMDAVLGGLESGSFSPTASVDPSVYFRGSNSENAIACVLLNGHAVEPPEAKFTAPPAEQSNIRVRGTATDLYVDRSAKSDFAATSKATFDLTQDNVLRKDTYKIVADVGYYIPTNFLSDLPGDRIDIVPYVGTNWNFVTVLKGSKGKPSIGNETLDAGLLFDTYVITDRDTVPVGHLITIQPDFLLNNVDESRIFSANLTYMPVLNSTLNSFRTIGDDFASAELILALKDDNGFYTDRGEQPLAHRDFIRLGGEIGFSLLSDNENIPLSLTTTYLGLHSVRGTTDIGYFSNSLTYSLDPNKYFGISLNYTNGRREDTAARQSQWEIALSGHF